MSTPIFDQVTASLAAASLTDEERARLLAPEPEQPNGEPLPRLAPGGVLVGDDGPERVVQPTGVPPVVS